jgi:hypothetical protein
MGKFVFAYEFVCEGTLGSHIPVCVHLDPNFFTFLDLGPYFWITDLRIRILLHYTYVPHILIPVLSFEEKTVKSIVQNHHICPANVF